MKKIFKYSTFILTGLMSFVQAQTGNVPEPTTGSLSSYINTPTSPATGVPSISIPLYQLESTNKDFSIGMSLSYHVYNAKVNIPASDVGQGWSLFTSGTITRQVMEGVDEMINWTDVTEELADIFYYNIPGHSGKFKIYKDSVSGNLTLTNLTGEKVKIEYEKNTANNKLAINNFTIIDDSGLKYFFQDYNIGRGKEEYPTYFNYKTAFF